MPLFLSGSEGTSHPHPLVCSFPKGKEPQEGKMKDRFGTYCTSPTAVPAGQHTWCGFQICIQQFPVSSQGVPGGPCAPFHNQGQLSWAVAPSAHLLHCPSLLVPSPWPRGRCGKLGLKIKNSRQQLGSQREGRFILWIKVPNQIIILNALKS